MTANSRRAKVVMAAAALAAAACASAGKRLEQGLDAAARGDWYQAAVRYADALDKEPTMSGARDGLLVAGDSAVRIGMRVADEALEAGDAVAAAEELRDLDALLARGREVRVTIPVPDGWRAYRRDAFDAAISDLMDDADAARDAERWNDARGALRRARRDFEPSPAQTREALDAEADVIVDQAGAASLDGRFRQAYELAAEALEMDGPLPRAVADAAADLQERALSRGLRVLAVFPVGSTVPVREAAETDLEAQLSDLLELGAWREPPLFVAVADPAAVRQTTRRLFPGGSTFRPGRVLDEVGADFGALVELTSLEVTESDVERTERTARTRQGRRANYAVERGQARRVLEATVTLFDERGAPLGTFTARSRESGRFERGVYEGDPQQLELSRGERLLFDAGERRARRAETEQKLVAELARAVAETVFGEVVRRIP